MLIRSEPRVAILLCTYQGQRFLPAQLDSFAEQIHTNWTLWVSDDGSTDGTRKILDAYASRWGNEQISVQPGPQNGVAANFLSLTCNSSIKADYYAYADQDDIWEPDKLNRALAWLTAIPEGTPALYCSRTRLIDENNIEIGLSPLFKKTPSFANAMVQNIGGGNTMVFNDPARKLVQSAGTNIDIVIHDWWLYLVVSACGGTVFYDRVPCLRYRQHDRNLVGMNSSWSARINRIGLYRAGIFKEWNNRNVNALKSIQDKMTAENQRVFAFFSEARTSWLIPRLLRLWRSGVYRQTPLANLGLVAAAIFGKL